MIVTAITPQKRDEKKFNIFIDGEYAFALPMQDILYFKLKEGREVPAETVEYIQESLIYIKAQDLALHFIGYKMRTVREIRMKLAEKEFSEEVIEKVIAFLEKYGYADDREYCRKYIKEKLRMKPNSGYALKIELKQRGISSRIIDEVMAETEVDEEGDAFRWLERKSRGQWPPENEKKKKQLYDFLLRKGYSYDIIGEAFRQMNEEYGGED
ncbi:MAG: RecX family transcriptional regulator [Anaerotignum sp.]|nr:RecX family transcriptional regulator [Anaerotignum sp.]